MPIGFHPCSSVFTRGFPVPTGLSGLRSNPLEFGYFPPRPRPARPRVVPEARKILAGGAVQRNHRTHRPQPNFAPRRGARTVIARHSRSSPRRVLRRSVFPATARQRGCQGDGRSAHDEASPWCGADKRLSRPAGAQHSSVRFFRWFRCASPPANFLRASGTTGTRGRERGRDRTKRSKLQRVAEQSRSPSARTSAPLGAARAGSCSSVGVRGGSGSSDFFCGDRSGQVRQEKKSPRGVAGATTRGRVLFGDSLARGRRTYSFLIRMLRNCTASPWPAKPK